MFEQMAVIPIPGFSEPVSALTHLVGSVVFAVVGFFLVRKGHHAEGPGWNWRMTGLAVFAVAAVAQLAISGTYHLLQPGLGPRLLMHQMDRTAIFILIAATFIPVHAILFEGWRRWLILLILFSMAAIGITFNLVYFGELPELVTLTFYFAMGWVGAYAGYALFHRYGWAFIRYIVWGGVAYTAGGICEYLRQPVLIEGIVGPHELFHVAVLAGVGFHTRFIYSIADWKRKPEPNRRDANTPGNSTPASPGSPHQARRVSLTASVSLLLCALFAPGTDVAAAQTKVGPDSVIDLVYLGGPDCPYCRGWEAKELPKLRKMTEYPHIRFTHVLKTIKQPVPQAVELPAHLKPMYGEMARKTRGRGGSPQFVLLLDGVALHGGFGTQAYYDLVPLMSELVAGKTGAKSMRTP